MKTLPILALAGVPLLATGAALAQDGHMMSGGTWDAAWMGGYGGAWVPIVLVIVLVGFAVWVVKRK
jgi:hypothetical protein